MKKTDLAYLAGIFDGEGSIWIGKAKRACTKLLSFLKEKQNITEVKDGK